MMVTTGKSLTSSYFSALVKGQVTPNCNFNKLRNLFDLSETAENLFQMKSFCFKTLVNRVLETKLREEHNWNVFEPDLEPNNNLCPYETKPNQ